MNEKILAGGACIFVICVAVFFVINDKNLENTKQNACIEAGYDEYIYDGSSNVCRRGEEVTFVVMDCNQTPINNKCKVYDEVSKNKHNN